jgi:hypothetical protein
MLGEQSLREADLGLPDGQLDVDRFVQHTNDDEMDLDHIDGPLDKSAEEHQKDEEVVASAVAYKSPYEKLAKPDQHQGSGHAEKEVSEEKGGTDNGCDE